MTGSRINRYTWKSPPKQMSSNPSYPVFVPHHTRIMRERWRDAQGWMDGDTDTHFPDLSQVSTICLGKGR